MDATRKRRLIQAGGILASVACILLLLAVLLPGRVELTQLTVEDLSPDDPKEAVVLEALGDLYEGAACGTVYRVREPRLLGADETFYLVPYLEWEIGDVGTAGGSDWWWTPGLLAFAWRGEEAIEPKRISLESSTLQIEADANTYLLWEGNSLEQKLEALSWRDAEDGLRYYVETRAATKDSAKEENADCLCHVTWEGAWSLRMHWNQSLEMRFFLEDRVSYRNNCV